MNIKDPRRTHGGISDAAGLGHLYGGPAPHPEADRCASEAEPSCRAGYDCYADKPINSRNDAVNVLMERAQELRRNAEALRDQAAKYRAIADQNVEQAVLLSRDIDALYAAAQLHAAN